MIYARKITERDYKNTDAATADHVLLTREEAETYNARFREAVNTVNALRQNLDVVLDEKRNLTQLIEQMRNEQDLFIAFTKERTMEECNSQNDTLRAMYEDAMQTITNLMEENTILRHELEQSDNGFYFT